MTKFIDSTKTSEEKKKKTEFVKLIGDDGTIEDIYYDNTDNYDNVELLRRKDNDYIYDLIVAYDDEKKGKDEYWFLGHWNDGC